MIKCILFDIGGVIVDFTNDEHYYPYLSRVSGVPVRAVKRFIEARLWVLLDKDMLRQKEFDRRVAERLGIEERQVRWYEKYEDEGRIDRGTMRIIERLAPNYQVSYLSNVDRSRYTWTLKLMKPYRKLFRYRLASCDIGLRKPDAAAYRYALRRMGLRSGEVVFVDNLLENVRGARRAGIRSILFTGSKDLEKRLKRMGIRL